MKYASTAALFAIFFSATADARLKQFPGVTFLPEEDNELVGGIDKGDLMQNNPSHWRKHWPEGATDNGQDDTEVLGRLATKKRSHKDARKMETYPWQYDEDVIHTGDSLALSESTTGKPLTHEGVGTTHRGLDWANEIEFFGMYRTDVAPEHSE